MNSRIRNSILLGGVVVVYAGLMISREAWNDQPALLVACLVAAWCLLRGCQLIGWLACWLLTVGLMVVNWGMLYWGFQTQWWVNHAVHLLCAALVGWIAVLEIGWRMKRSGGSHRIDAANRLLTAWAAIGMVLVLGIGLELAEAVMHWTPVSEGRFHDTIWDLVADLAGGALGVGWGITRVERKKR